MLKTLDCAILGVVAEKKNGLSCSKQFVSCLSYVGTISKISSIYQFAPEDKRIEISNQPVMSHICYSILLQLKDSEKWSEDFGNQIEQFALKSAEMTLAKNFNAKVLDFRSQLVMSKSVTVPFPSWILKAELLFPSLEIIPEGYIHPVLNEPLTAGLISSKNWNESEFLQTGRSLMAI